MRLCRLIKKVHGRSLDLKDPLLLLSKPSELRSPVECRPHYVKYGRALVEILINEHLGTRTVSLSPQVLEQYADIHFSTRTNGLQSSLADICIADLYLGRPASRKLADKLISGSQGLADLCLDAILNNER